MANEYRSEIRDSTIRDLLTKVKKQNFGQYLWKIKLSKVRAFVEQDVQLDFPVTALVGTNGGGKSTVLGAAALAYKAVKPATFFPKSSMGDQSMENWKIGYELIDKQTSTGSRVERSARFKQSKWARDDLIERTALHFGIQRTVPAGERTDFKKLASINYKFAGEQSSLGATIQQQVARILGKDLSKFIQADITPEKKFYIGGDGNVTYSEFHFGAGESSVIRMVSAIESAPENALVLVEEIENGLHPVAARKMVEYLIDVAERRSIQSIFTTHSQEALGPLPPEAIWSAIDGKVRQGKISIEALRAITGRIDESLAALVEDEFAKGWVESIVRRKLSTRIDEVGVYAVAGDSQALSIHKSHQKNPALKGKLTSLCLLDGNSQENEDRPSGVIKLPGQVPESEVFGYVRDNIDTLALKLTVALHLPADKEKHVKDVVESVSRNNRDPHLLFNQIGQQAGLVSESIVISAFTSLWLEGNDAAAEDIAAFIGSAIPTTEA